MLDKILNTVMEQDMYMNFEQRRPRSKEELAVRFVVMFLLELLGFVGTRYKEDYSRQRLHLKLLQTQM